MPTTETPTSDVFIHRHCMQYLLHEAISNANNQCYGLLTGSGNIVTNCLPVTKKLISPHSTSLSTEQKHALFGVYLATDSKGSVNQQTMTTIHAACLQQHQHKPDYYLILYLDHKGRIDARMYSDMQLNSPITLLMQEDNSPSTRPQ